MSKGSASKPEISLGDDFGDVLVKVNGATIDVSAAGYVVATSPSGVEWRAAANDDGKPKTAPEIGPEIGDAMDDGTIFAGISPDTHQLLYATPADAPLTYTFNEAADYARLLNAQKFLGHDDWRVPTKGELNLLFANHAAIGGFDLSGSPPAGWYRSSSQSEHYPTAWAQRFSDGNQDYYFKINASSLRCVR
jgi:hypothetical protein